MIIFIPCSVSNQSRTDTGRMEKGRYGKDRVRQKWKGQSRTDTERIEHNRYGKNGAGQTWKGWRRIDMERMEQNRYGMDGAGMIWKGHSRTDMERTEQDRYRKYGTVKCGRQVRQQSEAAARRDLLPKTSSPIHQLTQLLFGGLL